MRTGARDGHWKFALLAVLALGMNGAASASGGEAVIHEVGEAPPAAPSVPPLGPTCKDNQGRILIDFEGVGNLAPVGSSYRECGVEFSADSLGIIDADQGGSGNFANEPSPNTVGFFLNGSTARLNFAQGFTQGFSFYYSSINYSGYIRVYSEVDGGGTLLATLQLPVTPRLGRGDPNGAYDNWASIGVSFDGVARSVDFGGTANQIGFDNITLGTAVPLDTRPTKFTFNTIPIQTAGQVFSIVLRAVDAYGNTVRTFDSRTRLETATGDPVQIESGNGVEWTQGEWRGRVTLDLPVFSQRLLAIAEEVRGESNSFTVEGNTCMNGGIKGDLEFLDGIDDDAFVDLYDASGVTQIATTEVGVFGGYRFVGLRPGTYLIRGRQGIHAAVEVEVRVGCDQRITPPNLVVVRRDRPVLVVVPGVLGSTTRGRERLALVPELPKTQALIDELAYLDPWAAELEPVGLSDQFIPCVEGDYTVVEAPWDWRVPVDWEGDDQQSAWSRYLRTRIERVRRAASGNPSEPIQVDVVAHSMGGLLARAYIQSADYDGSIRTLVLVGTPNRGATATYFMAEGGDPQLSDDLSDGFKDGWVNFYCESARYEYETNVHPGSSFSSCEMGREYDPSAQDRIDFFRGYVPTLYELFPNYEFLLEKDSSAGPKLAARTRNLFLDRLNASAESRRLVKPGLTGTPCGGVPCVGTNLMLSNTESTITDIHVRPEVAGAKVYPSGAPYNPPWFVGIAEYGDVGDGTVEAEQASLPFADGSFDDGFNIEVATGDFGGHSGMLKGAKHRIYKALTNNSACPTRAATRSAPPASTLVIEVTGRVQPFLTSPQGLHLGVDPTDGEISEEIPGGQAILLSATSTLTLETPAPGDYVVELSGRLWDDFQLNATLVTSGGAFDSEALLGFFRGTSRRLVVSVPSVLSAPPALRGELEPPSDLVAEPSDGRVLLRWGASSSAGVTGYRVQRRFDTDATFRTIGEIDANTRTFLTNDVWQPVEGVGPRYYTVTAVDATSGRESPAAAPVRDRVDTVARFRWSRSPGDVLEIGFESTSLGNPTSLAWDFDADGATDASGGSAVHRFPAAGRYLVRLEASGPYGDDSALAVVDLRNSPPVAVAGADQVLECSGDGSASSSLDGSDSFDPEGAAVTCGWSSSTCWFENPSSCVTRVECPLGTHSVMLVVRDGELESIADDVVVTVLDTTPPQMLCPAEVVAECSGPGGAEVTIAVVEAVDACDGGLPVQNDVHGGGADASGYYPLGTTVVTFTTADAAGNLARCATTVMVVDTTPPTLSVDPSPNYLWPPNHHLLDVHANVSVFDVCDPTVVTILQSASSSEPDDAQGGGDGNTTLDIQGAEPGTPDLDLLLRAERAGGGNGRRYVLTYNAMDASGNAAVASGAVDVPHDQSGIVEPIALRMGAGGASTISWEPVYHATHFDVVRGRLHELRDEAAHTELGELVCLAAELPAGTTVGPSDVEVPEPGEVFFYLVQFHDGSDESSYGEASATKARHAASGSAGCH